MTRQVRHTRQQGFVLPIGMVMLLILTIIGVNAMRDGILQEKMASNYIDKVVSFQGGESALRSVQYLTLRTSYESIAGSTGFHSSVDNPLSAPVYSSIDLYTASSFAVTGIKDSEYYYSDPRAIIEEISDTGSLKFGKEPVNQELAERYFRITVQSQGETGSALSTLQGVAKR